MRIYGSTVSQASFLRPRRLKRAAPGDEVAGAVGISAAVSQPRALQMYQLLDNPEAEESREIDQEARAPLDEPPRRSGIHRAGSASRLDRWGSVDGDGGIAMRIPRLSLCGTIDLSNSWPSASSATGQRTRLLLVACSD